MLPRKFFVVSVVFFLTVFAYGLSADKVTEVKLHLHPDHGKIRPFETAVVHAEFYGKKRKGFLDSILGNKESTKSKVDTNDWKIEILSKNSGLLSKPFRYQEEGEKTKGGFAGFITQGIGAVSSKDSVLYTAPSKPGRYKLRVTTGNLKAETLITVSGSQNNSTGITLSSEDAQGKYAPLVKRYAPFIAQETWFDPRADYIARFDYDGNWKGDDNWENLRNGSSQAYVYYAVMETKTHWFLHYNFFHPRDYSDACVVGTCHENDNEGMILTVRKDGSPFGKVELLETLAHNNIYTFTNEKRIKKKVHNVDGTLSFYNETHPIIFIEAGGHGVLGGDYKTSFFDAKLMSFKQNTGVTYTYKDGEAERPSYGDDRNVGYSLISIEDSWWQRGSNESGEPNETFEKFYIYEPFGNRPKTSKKYIAGSFLGRTASDSMAKPFWGWHDRRTKKKKVLNTGQWALDPAYSLSVCYKWPKELPVATEYLYNPFLEEPRTP
ncbi:MAG: hypothetical protein HKN33_12015 [Pyrinomonadaceae bacterium]|nr:hypothetical protein [Pyrinomonadaceae bacterium]